MHLTAALPLPCYRYLIQLWIEYYILVLNAVVYYVINVYILYPPPVGIGWRNYCDQKSIVTELGKA
jgi:hypothetical protein